MFNDWLTKHNIPENVRNFLLKNTFPEGKKINNVWFDSPKSIIEWNEIELWPSLPENKLLTLGSAANGDLWAINFKTNPPHVVIISHDKIPGNDQKVIPDTVFIKVANSLEEFMTLAKEDKLPLDYYEAEERNK